jgi:hypothetical protein
MNRSLSASPSRESKKDIQCRNSNAGVAAGVSVDATRRSRYLLQFDGLYLAGLLSEYRNSELRATLKSQARNRVRSRSWAALRYTINITSWARSSLSGCSQLRARKKEINRGVNTWTTAAKVSGLGNSRNCRRRVVLMPAFKALASTRAKDLSRMVSIASPMHGSARHQEN